MNIEKQTLNCDARRVRRRWKIVLILAACFLVACLFFGLSGSFPDPPITVSFVRSNATQLLPTLQISNRTITDICVDLRFDVQQGTDWKASGVPMLVYFNDRSKGTGSLYSLKLDGYQGIHLTQNAWRVHTTVSIPEHNLRTILQTFRRHLASHGTVPPGPQSRGFLSGLGDTPWNGIWESTFTPTNQGAN